MRRDFNLNDELTLQAKEIIYTGGLSLQMTISGFKSREDIQAFADIYLGNDFESLPDINSTIH